MILNPIPQTNSAIVHELFDENEGNYFLLLNLNHQILTINDAFAHILQLDIHFVNSKPAKSIYKCISTEHGDWFRECFDMAKEGKTCQYEVVMKDEQEIERWIRFDFSPIFSLKNKIRGITCIGTNISKEKVQEQKIQNQKMLLKEIANTYSHELRHPLTNIMAIINIMKYDDRAMDKQHFQYLEIASKQLDAVINSVVNQTYMVA